MQHEKTPVADCWQRAFPLYEVCFSDTEFRPLWMDALLFAVQSLDLLQSFHHFWQHQM